MCTNMAGINPVTSGENDVYFLQTEIIDTDNIDYLALFIGDDDDTTENLGDFEY